MNRVLIITYYWPPSGGAGVQRWLKFTKYLPENGWEPIILTVDPKYASYPQIDNSLNKDIDKNLKVYKSWTFEVYTLFSFFKSKKTIPYGGFTNQKGLTFGQKIARFIRGNFFLPDPRRSWNLYAYNMAKKIIKKHHISTVITTSPPHSTQLVGLKLKKNHKIRWIADLRDPWSEIYYQNELMQTKLALQYNTNIELKVLKSSDKLITVSDGVKRMFAKKMSNSSKIEVIHNGYDESDFEPGMNHKKGNKIIITYTGTISEKYDIDGFIAAIQILEQEHSIDCLLRFIGNLPETVKSKLQKSFKKNDLEFIPYLPHHECIDYLYQSDLLLLIIPKVSENEGIVTGKIFEYLAVKRPIICLGPKSGDAALIIEECNSGETFDYGEKVKISNFILKYINNELAHYNYSSEIFSRRNLTKKLVEILETE